MTAHLHLAPSLTETDPSPSVPSPVRVVLADDHALMRRSLRLLLDSEEGVQVIAEAEDMAAAVRHVHGHKPQVLVLDLRMPGGSSIETIRKLVQNNQGVAFLPRMCVEQEIEQGLLREVKVKELHVERKIRLIYPTRRVLSHAARAFLEVVRGK